MNLAAVILRPLSFFLLRPPSSFTDLSPEVDLCHSGYSELTIRVIPSKDIQHFKFNMVEISSSLVLNTGSSSLWVISSNCHDSLFEFGSLPSRSISFQVLRSQRDFYTGTHAFGRIGHDVIKLAGLHLDRRGYYWSWVPSEQCNMVHRVSYFPLCHYDYNMSSKTHCPANFRDCSTAFFPHFEWLALTPRSSNIDDGASMTSHALASYSSQGPLLLRLIEEIYLDDFYLDVPRSNLLWPIIALSALVGMSNSLLRGPPDVISRIYHILNRGPEETFPCDTPHTLAFEIGVHPFSVDPRNFVSHTFENQVDLCTANLVDTDVPVLNEEGLKRPVPPDAEGRLKEVAEQANGKRKKNLEREKLPFLCNDPDIYTMACTNTFTLRLFINYGIPFFEVFATSRTTGSAVGLGTSEQPPQLPHFPCCW
ncbi:hypothetical protein DL96DRAFT_1717040 [Flagelloscypha sp. PMI_526]|nr:hypothetical protein DL96DRAFT_1717040 [Flagelloscypha sp. PMI_526]